MPKNIFIFVGLHATLERKPLDFFHQTDNYNKVIGGVRRLYSIIIRVDVKAVGETLAEG